MNPVMVFLDAIRDHLDSYDLPPACAVEVTVWSKPITVQLDATELSAVAAGLLRWVATLDEVSASIWRPASGRMVHLIVAGRTPCAIPVQVYGAVDFHPATFPDLPADSRHDVPVFVLRGWTAAGEVAA